MRHQTWVATNILVLATLTLRPPAVDGAEEYLLAVVIGGRLNLIARANAVCVPGGVVEGEGDLILREARPELLQLAEFELSDEGIARGEELARSGRLPRAKRSTCVCVCFGRFSKIKISECV